ncbi:MAG: hypothetical protein AAFV69_01925 [Pseudomonadota bacterium]
MTRDNWSDISVILAVGIAFSGLATIVYAAGSDPRTKKEIVSEIVQDAKPTADGTIHPGGSEPKPRENWMSPCPPDRVIKKDGTCAPLSKE